jgi:hypothetical protein
VPAPAPAEPEPSPTGDIVEEAPIALRLEGIDGQTCTINGRTYQPGDPVAGYVVQKISAATVTLRSGRTLVELKVRK